MTFETDEKMPFADLPEGTVTFLFSDIQGSTQLLYQLGDQFTAVLAEHHRIIREAVGHRNGRVVRTEGDAFFVAFPRATDAVAAAVEVQRNLAQYDWLQEAVIRVRMGIHTGEPEKALDDYVGIDIHRAARIAHVGHGGQVLLSETTVALVGDELPAGVSLLGLGRHLLKDIRRPERIYQLLIEGLPAEFPALTSLEVLPAEGARLPRQVGKCPYRGLSAFQEVDAPFYFGRETFVDALEQAVRTKKFVAVIVGSSGSGKSSALFAGLLPRLREEGGYLFSTFRPGNQPFYALAGALLPLLERDLSETDRLAETRKLAERLQKGEVSLSEATGRILEKAPESQQVLLMADQFEELYTLCPDLKLQAAFIDELLATIESAKAKGGASSIILLTLRADFMGQALAHRPFADALQEASLLMGPMTRQELHMAIEKPAELQGAAFEAGLVERILDDVGEKPGNLPLLEFTLTQLWEQQTDGWLTHANYEAMGNVEGALAAYADQVYEGLGEEEQESVRRALVQLVQPGEGTEDTRRIATRGELGDENWSLIQRLADRRLVVTGRDAAGNETAEVVHEALIQKWGRFQEWMDADRAFRAWQERLRGSLRQWQESGQDEGALLAGAPLAVAQNWLEERQAELSEGEVAYIQKSEELQERKQAERERRRRVTFISLATFLVIAIALAAFALFQRQEAFTQRQNSMRQAAVLLAGQAETELANGYHDRAVLLAMAALENYPYTPQAEHALGQAVSYNRAQQIYSGHNTAVTSISWSPDGKWVASSSSSENRVDIWDPVTGELIQSIDMPTGMTGNIYDMALHVQWTPDGKHLLTVNGDRYRLGSQDYDLLLWDAANGELISSIEIANQAEPESGAEAVSFVNYPTGAAAKISPISRRLATLGGDNTAIVWDADWEKPDLVLSGHTQDVNSIDWSPDESRLATASLDGTAIVWDAQAGQALYTLTGHEGRVNLALWSPDGSSLATAGEDGTLRIWDAANGTLVRIIDTSGAVTSLVWAPNSVRVITGQGDGTLCIWEVASGRLLETLRGHEGIVTDLKWSPLDDRLVSADGNGNVRGWNAAPSTAWRLYPPQAERGGDWSIQAADWSSDGHYLVMAGGDVLDFTEPASLEIWDVYANQLTMQNLGEALNLNGVWADFSPDNQRILYVGIEGFPGFEGGEIAYVFDASNGEIIKTFKPKDIDLVRSVAWSPDGSQVATGLRLDESNWDYTCKTDIWDYQTGELITRLSTASYDETDEPVYLEWSPDGSQFGASCLTGGVVFDARTWEFLYTVKHEAPAWTDFIAWSPDGRHLLTGGGSEDGTKDNTIRVWDVETTEESLVISGHAKSVVTGDWSPDGERIATFSDDGTVRVWDSSTGDELLTLSVPVLYGGATWWSPDGEHLAIVGLDTLISVWRVWQTKEELIDYAKECCVFRDLTDAERQQYGLPER